MRAWLLDSYRGVDHLRLADVADPQPSAGQVLLKIAFAALNPADAFLAEAMYPARPPLPHVLGRDGVGNVVQLGAGVERPPIGTTVGVLLSEAGVKSWGTLAEKVVVPASKLVQVPRGWSLEQMAGAPLVFLTAWQALTQWSTPPEPLPAGSVVLITGASGGVGVASFLLAKTMNLTVVALSRSANKRAWLAKAGCDFVFDPGDPDFRANAMNAIAPKKVDLVVDMVAGPLFNEVITMLGYGGRVSVVGRSGGAVPDFNTARLFFGRNRIGGVAVSDYSTEVVQKIWVEIVDRMAAAGVQPVVDRVFSFEDVKSAFARLATGPLGKVVVEVGSST